MVRTLTWPIISDLSIPSSPEKVSAEENTMTS